MVSTRARSATVCLDRPLRSCSASWGSLTTLSYALGSSLAQQDKHRKPLIIRHSNVYCTNRRLTQHSMVNPALHPPLKALPYPLTPGLTPLWTLQSSASVHTPDPAHSLLWERALVRLHSRNGLQYQGTESEKAPRESLASELGRASLLCVSCRQDGTLSNHSLGGSMWLWPGGLESMSH